MKPWQPQSSEHRQSSSSLCPQVSRQTPYKATGTGSTSNSTGTGGTRPWAWLRGLGWPTGQLHPDRPHSRSLRNFFRRAADMLYFKRLIQIPRLPEVPARGTCLPAAAQGAGQGPRWALGMAREGSRVGWGDAKLLLPVALAGPPQLPTGLSAGGTHQASGGHPRGGPRG